MSYTEDRERFIAAVMSEGLNYYDARKLLRYASTLQRLAVAQCNGDWPADNGERKTIECSRCRGLWAPSSMRKDHSAPKITGPGESAPRWIPLICQDCRTEELIRAVLPDGWKAITGGDPRGAVLRLDTPKYPYDPTGARGANGLYVPARER